MNQQSFKIEEICSLTGLDPSLLKSFIDREWINPPEPDFFDHEDVARVHLILELEHDLGVNEEAISVVLHLIDQIHYLRGKIQQIGRQES